MTTVIAKIRDEWNAFHLADRAGCGEPETTASPGAQFLLSVRDAFLEGRQRWLDGGEEQNDVVSELADSAIPAGIHERWWTFTDLRGWEQNTADLGDDFADLTQTAAIALYMIAESLMNALEDEINEDDAPSGPVIVTRDIRH